MKSDPHKVGQINLQTEREMLVVIYAVEHLHL